MQDYLLGMEQCIGNRFGTSGIIQDSHALQQYVIEKPHIYPFGGDFPGNGFIDRAEKPSGHVRLESRSLQRHNKRRHYYDKSD